MPKCTTYASISALTSSGVLLVQNADLHVKGSLNGKITLGCVDTVNGSKVNSGLSKVWIDGQLTYHTPPPSTIDPNPTVPCTDMLGLVATNNIMVSEFINHDNRTTGSGKTLKNLGTPLANVTINASMFSQTGGFGAENPQGRDADGTLKIVGGLQQHQRNIVGYGTSSGFLKDYDFDNDLNSGSPVGYPKTPFVVQAWVDYTNIKDLWSLWN